MSREEENNLLNEQKPVEDPATLPKDEADAYSNLFKTLIINSLPNMIYAFIIFLVPSLAVGFIGKYSEGVPNGAYIIDGVGIAMTFMNFLGGAIFLGLNIGLIALSAQAYGAQNHKLVGLYFHRGLIINIIILACLCCLIIFSKPILESIGIATLTAQYASQCLIGCIGGIFAFMLLDTMRAYLIGQGLFVPQLIVQLIIVIIEWFAMEYFVIKLNLGIDGMAWAFTITYGSGAILLFSYITIFNPRPNSWFFFEKQSFYGLFSLLMNEIPIGSMIFLELIAYELSIVFAVKYLPEQTAGLIIYYNATDPFLNIPGGFSIVCTSFVGRAMGEKNIPKTKKLFNCNIVICSIMIILFELFFIFFSSKMMELFTNDEDILRISEKILAIYCLILPLDFLQVQLGGYIRGIGRENIGFVAFAISLYGLGLPCAYYIGSILGYNVIGIIIGIGIGIACVFLFYILIICMTDFESQVIMIEERILQNKILSLKMKEDECDTQSLLEEDNEK